MKIGGVDPKTLPNEEYLVLPRQDQAIVLRARGLQDLQEFAKMCPEPTAPVKLTPNGTVPDPEQPGYKASLGEYQKRRLAYLVVKSLEPSEIEWDTVKTDVPATWMNWEQDLRANNFSQTECNLVLMLVMQANALDEAKLQKAREVFLRGPRPALAA